MADEGPAQVVEQPPAEQAPTPQPLPVEKPPEGESEGAQLKVQEKKKGCWKSFTDFMYDGQTGKVLGRGGMSWLKIFVFYVIFYIAVFGFFFMLLFIVLNFTKEDSPRLAYPSNHSLLKGHPGLGFRPINPHKEFVPNSALIWYNKNNGEEIEKFVKQLREIVEKEDKVMEVDKKKINYINCDINTTPAMKKQKVCKAYGNKGDWGDCVIGKGTGKEENQTGFGYEHGKPCVLIRLNRIIGWQPNIKKAYKESEAFKKLKEIGINPDEISKDLLDTLNDMTKYVWIACFGERPVDKALVGDIKFYPDSKDKGNVRPPMTIPYTFFPFRRQKGYVDPFIMVQFLNPTPGVLIQVRCQAYNENIAIDAKDGLGSVRFELMVDSFEKRHKSF